MDELLDMEHAGWASLCNGTASEFYGDVMTDEAVMVLANGTVMTRDEVIQALRDAPPWAAYEIDDVRFVSVGHLDCRRVPGNRTPRRGGTSFVGVMTSIYVERDGHWKLALYQQTPKP